MTSGNAAVLQQAISSQLAQEASSSVPDLIEPVLAFRAWKLGPGGLLSLHTDEWWPLGAPLEARCLRHQHLDPAPVSECDCGIYGYHEPWTTASWCAMRLGEALPGAMLAWGRVDASFYGIRAQFAKVACVAVPRWTRPALRKQIYEQVPALGVQVTTMRELARVASCHGAPTPEVLRGEP